MTIHISGRGVVVSAVLRRRVEAKVARVTRFLPKITEARVVLVLERYRRLAQITLQAKRTTLHAQGVAGDFHVAVAVALENVEQQVRRRKDRIRERKPRSLGRRSAPPRGRPASVPENETAAASARPEVAELPELAVRRISAKPMSIDEALEQMRVRRQNLLVFTNARSRIVNVLHRRTDGALELVEPAG